MQTHLAPKIKHQKLPDFLPQLYYGQIGFIVSVLDRPTYDIYVSGSFYCSRLERLRRIHSFFRSFFWVLNLVQTFKKSIQIALASLPKFLIPFDKKRSRRHVDASYSGFIWKQIAQRIHLRLPFCSPRFECQAHHLCFSIYWHVWYYICRSSGVKRTE